VPTPSKFKSSEAVDAGVFCRLTINTMGAMTPPEIIAPASHFISSFLMPASFCCAGRVSFCPSFISEIPVPLPR
jgi:hypothetical protein